MNTDNLIEHITEQPVMSGSAVRYRDNTDNARYIFDNVQRTCLLDVQWAAYAWPGGYQIHYTTQDGGTLCHECANAEFILTIDPDDSQFHIVAADVHWEGPAITCDHCNREITPEYEGETP